MGELFTNELCWRYHVITSRDFIWLDLNSITLLIKENERENYKVINGLIPLMPIFEIEPQDISNLLTYLHSLK